MPVKVAWTGADFIRVAAKKKTFFSKVCSVQTRRRQGRYSQLIFLDAIALWFLPCFFVHLLSSGISKGYLFSRSSWGPLPVRLIPATLHQGKRLRHPTAHGSNTKRFPTVQVRQSPPLPTVRFIPDARLCSSYVTDPQWARKFTITWTSVVAAAVIASLPYFYRSVRQGRALTGAFGITESWNKNQYVPTEERRPRKRGTSCRFWVGVMRARAIFSWTWPGLDISVGQSG
jgi:hypothetical protein